MVKRPPSGDIKFTAYRLQPTYNANMCAKRCVLWKILNIRQNTPKSRRCQNN